MAMTYKKSTHAGEPCLALGKKINLAGFTIAGAAALLVALAGNVRAIPFTAHDEVVNSAISSQNLRSGQSDYEAALALDHGNRNQGHVSPTAPILSRSARVQNTSQLGNSSPRISRPRKHGHGVEAPSPQSTGPNPPPVSVPDGGTTATMLGGVFCGLVLLEKKLKAWPALPGQCSGKLRRGNRLFGMGNPPTVNPPLHTPVSRVTIIVL